LTDGTSLREDAVAMARTSTKWLLGCGIGCGVLLALALVVGLFGLGRLRESLRGVEEATETHRELTRSLGQVEDHVPFPGGVPTAARIETFLEVRESLGASRAGLEDLFADFPPDDWLRDDEAAPRKVFRVLRGLGDLLTPIGEHVAERNRILLQRRMPLGEYLYLYLVAYHSWLGHPPDDGPVITKDVGDRGQRIFGDDESTFSPRKVRRRYRRMLGDLLANQRDGLSETAPDGLRRWLQEAIDGLERDPDYVAWEDGLPPAIEAALAPYRARFRATYSSVTNCFELPLAPDEGR
jgi:hypothetical protein